MAKDDHASPVYASNRSHRLYAAERQQLLLTRARIDGHVEVQLAADDLGVTPETIRKDLQVLERGGLMRRVHGGALPVVRVVTEIAVADRIDPAPGKTGNATPG